MFAFNSRQLAVSSSRLAVERAVIWPASFILSVVRQLLILGRNAYNASRCIVLLLLLSPYMSLGGLDGIL